MSRGTVRPAQPQPAVFIGPEGPGALQHEISDPTRLLAFRFALVVIFLRFSMFHFVLFQLTHVNFYLLYLFGVPTLLGLVLSGGLRRSFRGATAWCWTGFAVWMALGVPFSTWKGGSFQTVVIFARSEFPMLLIMAGFAMTWSECRRILYAVALGAGVSVVAARVFQHNFGDTRLGLVFGTVANPNDYAAHLLLVLPFLLWIAFASKSKPVKLAALAGVLAGIFLIVATASRGAAVALLACIILFLLRAPMRRRIAVLALAPVLAAALLTLSSRQALNRLTSFSGGDPAAVREAIASAELRKHVLQRSIIDTFQHPLFGVGSMQFMTFEGANTIGAWREPHNTFTMVSSECGVPAFLFYAVAVSSTLYLFNSIHKQARRRPDCEDIRDAAFCMMLAMTGFCAAIFFLNFAYQFYLPAMGGLAIAMSQAAKREMEERAAGAPPAGRQGAGALAQAAPGTMRRQIQRRSSLS